LAGRKKDELNISVNMGFECSVMESTVKVTRYAFRVGKWPKTTSGENQSQSLVDHVLEVDFTLPRSKKR
jgi:hypothetical protein